MFFKLVRMIDDEIQKEIISAVKRKKLVNNLITLRS